MFIEPIQVIQSIDQLNQTGSSFKGKADGGFQDIFKTAWSNAKETKEDYAYQQYLLSTGQIDDPHTVSIAASKAEMSVELLVQLRNKALEAYDQLMRTSM